LSPSSPGADQIDTLLWIGFVAAAILIVVVVGGLLYTLRRFRAERGAEPRQVTGGRAIQLRVGGALAIFALAIFVISILYTDKAREASATGEASSRLLQLTSSEPLKITTTGQQWIWRYDYPNEAFSYYKLIVPVDTAVELDLVSTDVVHTWDVPELAGKRDAVPGKTNHVLFRADEEGTFRGQAATMSGQAYAAMRTEVEVVSPEEYQAFIEDSKKDIQAAQDRVVGLIEAGETP
jgi:cytochrome c oxidase subunit II